MTVGIATFWFKLCQMVYHCYSCCFLLADVIAKMADGISIICVWQMLLPGD